MPVTWMEDFTVYAHERLDDRVRDALASRGVTDNQIDLLRIGYVDGVVDTGSPHFNRWADGRLVDMYVFPLTNLLGEVRGFQFRPVNRRKHGFVDYFEELGEATLFGLGLAGPHIREKGRIAVAEGPFDYFPLQRHLPETVATLTAQIPGNLIPFIQLTCEEVVFVYDNDATGRRGVERFRKAYPDLHITDVIPPAIERPEGKRTKDPNDLWEVWGDQRVGSFLSKCIPSKEFV